MSYSVKVYDLFETSRNILVYLKRHGYTPCSSEGNPDYVLLENQVSFLKPTPPSIVILGIGFPLLRADTFIGTIKNINGGIWKLDVNGFENLTEMAMLAEKIQVSFAHIVDVNLVSDRPKFSHR